MEANTTAPAPLFRVLNYPGEALATPKNQPCAWCGSVRGFAQEWGEAWFRCVVRWAYDLPVEPACGFRTWPDFGAS